MDKELIVSAKMYPSDCHHGYTIRRTDGFVIADVMPIDEDGIEGRAYANCFATAVEMREALKRVLPWFTLLDSSGMTDIQVADMDSDVETAERILAKAQGES